MISARYTYPILVNPNLHPDGKVCLSLLGTWFAGDSAAQWQPGISTVLQALLSIRAMILVSNSFRDNIPVGDEMARYSEMKLDAIVKPQTIWFFMLEWFSNVRKRDGVWKKVIKTHFLCHRETILDTVGQWARHESTITNWPGLLLVPGHVLRTVPPYVPGFGRGRTFNLLHHLETTLATLQAPASDTVNVNSSNT